MRRVNAFVLRVFLLTNRCPELPPCFAGLHALVPRVIDFFVPYTSAVSEPRTAATATTNFPGFRDGTTFWAHGTDGRRNNCSY